MNKRMIWYTEGVQEVMDLLAQTKKSEEIELIIDRILTTREINDIARRYRVFKMIDEGKSYTDIMVETGMSSSTICKLSAKCGFGFQKSSGLKKPIKQSNRMRRVGKIKYKGITVKK